MVFRGVGHAEELVKTAKTTTVPQTIEGQIVHTEILTRDASSLKRFLEKNFGWQFQTLHTPQGDYHLFNTPGGTRGGVGEAAPGQAIGGVPYIVVKDIQAARQKLQKAGAVIVLPPTEVPGGWMVRFRYEDGPILACWEYTSQRE